MTRLYTVKTELPRKELRLLWARIVLALAGERLGVEPRSLRIETDGNGKPRLCEYPDFSFNVSHTKGLLVIAASDRPVGVDAEKLRPINEKLAARFFTQREHAFVLARPDEVERRFFTVWTRKEAYLKQLGIGIRIPLASFDVLDGSLPVRIDTLETDGYLISCCHTGECEAVVPVSLDPSLY